MKIIRTLSLSLIALLSCNFAIAQDSFPNRPINLIVPYPAGGLSDVIARMVNAPLSKQLSQPVIIENLSGAGGAIAA